MGMELERKNKKKKNHICLVVVDCWALISKFLQIAHTNGMGLAADCYPHL